MPAVSFPTLPPYNDVVVNTDTVFAAIGELQDPQRASDLLLDAAGGRSIFVTAPITQVGQQLGSDFVQFQAAAVHPGPCFVNKRAWVSVNPHPQVTNVTQIHGHNRYIAVQGSVAQVQAALS